AAAAETPAAAARPAPAAGPPPGMPVEAEVVKSERIAQDIIAVGSLRSNESVTLSSEIAGRISGIHFREGQPVDRGALLFELDDSIHRAELDQARAGLSLAERNHQRAAELFERNLVSTRERDEAASRLDVEKAAVALAQARLAKTRIRAPFEGVIGLRAVSPGDYITAGQALAPLEQLSVLKADFRLSEAALSAIKVGQTLNLEVDAWPGQVFPGKVYAIDPRLAEETRSIGVRARVPNDKNQLRPGLFARVRLVISEREGAVLVPEQAIVPQGDSPFVYVIENGQAAMRPVTLGLRQAGRVEVVSGVRPGDVVITAGVQKIGPGAPVMAINLAPPGDGQSKTPAAGEKSSPPG
ncbi:MAG: efflux RND transporter periplasmic adaptor subunit, partial [Gammaproteobacteria bacterium]